MADRLPQEMLIDILARLTVRDLVRYITVSKLWYSLITSPNFISFHIKRTTANSAKNSLLLVRDYHNDQFNVSYTEQYSLHFDNDSFGEYKINLGHPFKVVNPNCRVIGSFNGVLCVSDDLQTYMNDIILWNPSIRKSVTLPKPLITYPSHGPFMHTVGFGFNPVTNDYKVVRVVHLVGNMDSMIPPMVEVYELSVGGWRIVDSKGFSYLVDERSTQIFLNGAIHWTGCKLADTDNGLFSVIVTFDLESEVLGVMKLPDSVADRQRQRGPPYYVLSKFEELLSLIQHAPATNGDYCSSMWVMKDDSWTKLFVVDLIGGLRGVFGCRKNGEALLTTSRRTVIVSYDPKRKELKHIKKFQSSRSVDVENFVESLALLDVKGKSVMNTDPDRTVSAEGAPNVHAQRMLRLSQMLSERIKMVEDSKLQTILVAGVIVGSSEEDEAAVEGGKVAEDGEVSG